MVYEFKGEGGKLKKGNKIFVFDFSQNQNHDDNDVVV
jgi:hypothetical protein